MEIEMETATHHESESEKEINLIRSVVGSRVSEPDILKALSCCNNNAAAAINYILDNPLPPDVKKTVTSTGARISGPVKQEIGEEELKGSDYPEKGAKKEPGWYGEYYKWLDGQDTEKVKKEGELKVKAEPYVGDDSKAIVIAEPIMESDIKPRVKAEPILESDIKPIVKAEPISSIVVKEEKGGEVLSVQPLSARPVSGEYAEIFLSCLPGRKAEKKVDMTLSTVVIEDGDFPEEADWMLVGRNVVTGLSTTKGRKIENNEIVHFAFPKAVSSRYSKVTSSIVRFSTKRFGEIGRLPMEWGNCLIPLVNSKKVKVLGRCVAAPANLQLMQEIMLYVSFYIHSSVFKDGDKSSWRIDCPSEIETTIYPLLTLFKLLKINPFQKGDSVGVVAKRIKGCIEQNKTEQGLSESTLNKLVGAAEMYDLKEIEPPETLVCSLRPYQKQALYWMSELEKGTEAEQTAKVLHPCWAAYRICDEPILVLPPTDIQVIECEQSEAERDFYDALYKKSKVQFDEFVAQGKVLHNFANILELLLRLRQCCNHPFLVMSRGDTDKYANLNKLAKKFLDTNPDLDKAAETNPDSASQNVPTRAFVEEVVEEIRKGENTECPICLESADDPVLTPCAHTMCRECLLSSWRNSSCGMCPMCRRLLNRNELITCPSANKFRIDVQKDWKESSKVTKLMDCLQRIRDSGSGEKSIVFSQWTLFLDLLEIPLRKSGIGFLRFDGKTQQKRREKVLHEFSETTEKMVLLMSLKAGGVGLNLTAASNVFLMDPWWNPAVEEQAIMRIHRIGQKRTVCVRRFIVKETVEERMQQVQARKQKMIAGALTDDEVRSARIEELKMLFR
nr:putative SWI/SNF-related matrix-associated actin-dependent regulator of chromatin subfamily A member 3-like 3 isoform X2 [Ipomoea trifida]